MAAGALGCHQYDASTAPADKAGNMFPVRNGGVAHHFIVWSNVLSLFITFCN